VRSEGPKIGMIEGLMIGTMIGVAERDMTIDEAIGTTEMMTDKKGTITIREETTGEVEPLKDLERVIIEAEGELRMRRNSLRWADRPQKKEET
jgi:tRNA (Thr-GGU) A37 N-methylase